MSDGFWNSPARVRRTEEDDVTGPIGEGTLKEMVEMFLAQPVEERRHLALSGDRLDGDLGLEQVQDLHGRDDFPGAY